VAEAEEKLIEVGCIRPTALPLALKAATRLLSDMGEGTPASGCLRGTPWDTFTVAQLAEALEKAVPDRNATWLGLQDGGWVRDAFLIAALKVWPEGSLLKRFGKTKFSPSIALRAACKDQSGRVRYDHKFQEFCISTLTGRQLVDRVNKESWTVEEVLEEAHGLYIGASVLSQVLFRAGAAPLGAAMTFTLHAHRCRVVELLGRDKSRRGVFWTE
jgi:hypothetical protein